MGPSTGAFLTVFHLGVQVGPVVGELLLKTWNTSSETGRRDSEVELRTGVPVTPESVFRKASGQGRRPGENPFRGNDPWAGPAAHTRTRKCCPPKDPPLTTLPCAVSFQHHSLTFPGMS